MLQKFQRELAALELPRTPPALLDLAPVTLAALGELPSPARRYLDFMEVLGKPRDWSFRLAFDGRFRRSPRERWMRCKGLQYNTRLAMARIFYLELRLFGLLPVLGRDTYVGGRGRMLIRALDLVTVGDGTGEEYDIGELVTYLNDAVMLAPSLLLAPEVQWEAIDETTFGLALSDHGRTVRARVSVDERGAPVDFETTDRFYADPKDPKRVSRCRWTTPIDGWQRAGEGRWLPTSGRAVWHPDGGESFAYAELRFDAKRVRFNLPPAL